MFCTVLRVHEGVEVERPECCRERRGCWDALVRRLDADGHGVMDVHRYMKRRCSPQDLERFLIYHGKDMETMSGAAALEKRNPRLLVRPAKNGHQGAHVLYWMTSSRRTTHNLALQHAVSLAYIVPIDGEASPAADALDLAWVTPEEAMSPEVIAEMTGGHDRLLRLALGHTGQLP